MSFNSTWTYTLPATVNPVVPGTRITTAWAITTLDDIALAFNQVGYRDIPNDSNTPITGTYTFALTDRGKMKVHAAADTTARTWTINNALAWNPGSAITIVNEDGAGALTITITGSGAALYLAGSATAGNRTIAPAGVGTLIRISATKWYLVGLGVS